ncbi:MAG: carbon-nitrogen hydrolase family protein [Rhodobacteraceae bacterium]|nr:carbon-nitrogen hydrolase family protein [Paracoccaceae bacterium]
MKIAAAAYPLDWFDTWADYEAKLTRWVTEAAEAGASLLVFPEYGAMELASLGGKVVAGDLEGSLREVARHKPASDALYTRLAARFGLHILSASGPVFEMPFANGRPVNRATLFGPEGLIGHQDKAMMTRFEREGWDVVGGDSLTVFNTAIGRMGVNICYDSEFPLLARAQAEAGVEIILVPSATEALAGFTRVRVGAMARALENQCIAVHAPVVGKAPWCMGMEENTGRASIYGPPDKGFPATGILAEGAMGEPGWVYAEVSLDAVAAVRADGGVLNFSHWEEQHPRVANLTFVGKN